jgi:hypothetical protein
MAESNDLVLPMDGAPTFGREYPLICRRDGNEVGTLRLSAASNTQIVDP